MKITLIKPGLGNIILGYNLNDGSMEPLQLAIIAGLVTEPDEVIMYDDRLEKIPFDEKTDLVCITVDSFSARRAYEISGEYRKRGINRILGGNVLFETFVLSIIYYYLEDALSILFEHLETVWNTLYLNELNL